MGDLLGTPNTRPVHTRDHNTQRIPRNALPDPHIARLEIRVEGHLETDLLAALGPLAHVHAVEIGPALEVLRFVVLVDCENCVAVYECEVGVACCCVVRYGKGEVGCSGGGAELVDGPVAVGVEASAFGGGERWVFNPELEASVGADGGY